MLKSLFDKGDFFKRRLQQSCFPANTAKFLRIAIFIENLWWMVLDISARISEASAKISYTEICKVI